MIKFNQFIDKIKPKYIGWDNSTFYGIRNLINKRKIKLKESFFSQKRYDEEYRDGEIDPIHRSGTWKHTDPLTPNEEHVLTSFTSGAAKEYGSVSGNYDSTGEPISDEHKKYDRHTNSEDLNRALHTGNTGRSIVRHHIKTLCNAIRPGRTNTQDVILHSGIPPHAVRQLSEEGGHTNRFISASTNEDVAHEFASSYGEDHPEVHMLKIHAPPGTAMSVVHHSFQPQENEVIIPPYSHMTYHGKTLHPTLSTEERPVYVHHVSLDPSKRIPIDDINL